MTTIKLLSAGLFAVAMLATPAVAHEHSAVHRYLAEGVNTSATAHHVGGSVGNSAPHAGTFTAMPLEGEDDTCDVGDTPHIC